MQAACTCFHTLVSSQQLAPNNTIEHNALGIARFASTLYGSLILTEIYEGCCQACSVRNACEKKFRGLVQLVLETFLADFQYVCDVREAQEVLHVMESVGFGIGVRQLCVDLGLAEGFAGHLQESNEVVLLPSAARYFDDFDKVGRVFGLNVRVYNVHGLSMSEKG